MSSTHPKPWILVPFHTIAEVVKSCGIADANGAMVVDEIDQETGAEIVASVNSREEVAKELASAKKALAAVYAKRKSEGGAA